MPYCCNLSTPTPSPPYPRPYLGQFPEVYLRLYFQHDLELSPEPCPGHCPDPYLEICSEPCLELCPGFYLKPDWTSPGALPRGLPRDLTTGLVWPFRGLAWDLRLTFGTFRSLPSPLQPGKAYQYCKNTINYCKKATAVIHPLPAQTV